MKDIECRKDIELIMSNFYEKLFNDERISFLFKHVAHTNLDIHLPSLCDFWENLLFGQVEYKKNVMQIHQHIHTQSAFTKEHFDIWLSYFKQTVDDNFKGDYAQNMKDRAHSIAYVMQTKILGISWK